MSPSLETTPHYGDDGPVDKKNIDLVVKADDAEVERMGYTAEMPRKFTLISVFAIGYAICGAPSALLVGFGVPIGSGGAANFVWGQVLMYLIAFCVAISLAELASAYPNAGGQYYWAAMLAPKSQRRLLSFVVGYLSWLSAIFICASVCLAAGQITIGIYAIRHPVTVQPWMIFIVVQLSNIMMFLFGLWEHLMPQISRIWLALCMASALICFVTMLARSPKMQPASAVFAGFNNFTGWSDGLAFLTGLLSVNWGFSCLDAVTHMAEEIPEPRRNIPKALIGTVCVNALVAWPMGIALMFVLQDAKAAFDTPTGLPSLELFLQVFERQTTGPIALECLLLLCCYGSIFGIQTWQARLGWAIARDNGMPFSKYISRIAPKPYDVPLWAHVWSCALVAVLGCLYLGSSVAFNSFVSGGILMQYIAYSICIICALVYGRSRIPRGPFWLGKFGLLANIVTIGWTGLTLVIYSFPPYNPPTLTTMNYVSVVLVGLVLLFLGYYAVYARKTFTGPPDVE